MQINTSPAILREASILADSCRCWRAAIIYNFLCHSNLPFFVAYFRLVGAFFPQRQDIIAEIAENEERRREAVVFLPLRSLRSQRLLFFL